LDEPQITLQSLLNGIVHSNIIEIWRIRRIGGLSKKSNLVVLLDDGTHLCTCLETITKGIICRHFWRVMLYSSSARFHISIIPTRWYKESILDKLDMNLENSPILTAVESSTNNSPSPFQVTFTLQSLHNFQGDCNKIVRQNIPQRNRFGIAFSVAKTAINIALETNKDGELVKILKDFIAARQKDRAEVIGNANEANEIDNNLDNNITECDIINKEDSSEVVPLQQRFINETANPNITKIRGAPCKKRIKNVMEISKNRGVIQEESSNIHNNNQSGRSQRRCLLCGKPGHYQKKCPDANK